MAEIAPLEAPKKKQHHEQALTDYLATLESDHSRRSALKDLVKLRSLKAYALVVLEQIEEGSPDEPTVADFGEDLKRLSGLAKQMTENIDDPEYEEGLSQAKIYLDKFEKQTAQRLYQKPLHELPATHTHHIYDLAQDLLREQISK